MALRIDRKVVLASASPSRKMLLEQAGVDFEVVVSGVDETVPPEFTPAQTVETLAQRKGEAVLALRPEMPIIAADSVVSIDGLILGKPADESEAHAMLRALSGRAHEVFTGVCLRDAATGREMVEEVKTAVRFRELTDEEIWDYIRTGEPMDKAGAYGIQGGAGAFVEGLDGSFENVMGFPVDDVERMLRAFTGEG